MENRTPSAHAAGASLAALLLAGALAVSLPRPASARPPTKAAKAASKPKRAIDWPLTRAESSNYKETSHYEDVVAFLEALQANGAPISVQYIGTSKEGRRIPMAIAARPPVATAAEARRLGKPIVYLQANIHAGEVEGKEAALIILRRLCKENAGLLDKMVILCCPIYNIDGNEKWGPVARNRPEQDGPDVVGVRANGMGLDLNRDCIKAESPEMRGVLEHIYLKWEPDVVIDLHTTDGTRHGYDLTYAPPLNPNTDPTVMKYCRDELLPTVRKQARAKGKIELFDYGNAGRDPKAPRANTANSTSPSNAAATGIPNASTPQRPNAPPSQAWLTFGEEGRYVTNYAGVRNRIAILSEATTYLPFKDRIESTDLFTTLVLEHIAKNAAKVIRLTREADARVVAWGSDPKSAPELGVRFEMALRGTEPVLLEKPPAKGESRTAGRPKEVVAIKMPVYDRFATTKTAKFPSAYLIPADQIATVELLKRHGIVVEKLLKAWSGSASSFKISKATAANQAFQGHRLIDLQGAFSESAASAPPGWFVVRTAQPQGTLAFHILEPESLDGAAAWGFLGDKFEVGSLFPILKVFGPVAVPSERQ